jgi:hypothetical protein
MKARFVVTAGGALTDMCATGPGLTVTPADIPASEEFAVSVAVIVCNPAVFKVTEKLPVPFCSFMSDGNTAWLSLLVMCTVPV